jgi:hypothetical protein
VPAPRLVDYLSNTVPYAKQEEAFAAALSQHNTFGDKFFFLAMEQRTGKTPVAIGLMAYHYEQKHVDAALIVAMPSGVPRNWADEVDGCEAEGRLPRMPARIKRMVLVWRASDASKKSFQERLEQLLAFPGLAILAVNGEAVLTDAFRKFAPRFLRKRRVYAIVDETSLVIAWPGNKRTKVLNGVRPLTEYRLILDGTPANEGPLSLYSQLGWLSPLILGQPTFLDFKHHYAEWEKRTAYDKATGRVREYPAIKEDPDTGQKMYLHLDELKERLDGVSFICKRSDCFDIPDRVYTPYRFELTPTQRAVYDRLRDEYEAELADGTSISAKMVLTRYLRLQQIISNFWPAEKTLDLCDECAGSGCEACDGLGAHVGYTSPKVVDPKRNSQAEALADVLATNRGPVIVWSRFTHDIEATLAEAKALGRTPVRYDGKIDADEKHHNKMLFQTGKADLLAANQAAAQRGLDLSEAQAHVYRSNTFSGLQREQTEARTEVAGRTKGTGIIDLTAIDTVCEDITLAHL